MSQQLFIDGSGHPGDPIDWAVRSELNTIFHTGQLSDISVEEGTSVVLVFSGLDVLLLSAPMPTRNQQKIRQALPYLFEEQLIEDTETLHFAMGPLKSDRLQVAVIAKERLQEWIDALTAVGIQLDSAVTDIQLLTPKVAGWTVWCNEYSALVRTEEGAGFACDREQLVELLAALPRSGDHSEPVDSVHIHHEGELDLFPFTSNLADMTITEEVIEPSGTSRFQFLLEQFTEQKHYKPIELLQAQYAPEKPSRISTKLAAIACSVTLLLVVGYSSLLWYQNSRFETQHRALQQQITSLYRSTFPNEKRVIDAKVQMQGHLRKLAAQDTGGGGLFGLMASVAQVTDKNSQIEFKQLRFQKNSLELKFEAGSLQVVEQFRDRIHTKGLTTKILSANKDTGRVKARLKIEAAS
ncbi:MAG: type II secretion system protein GspL [Pseudomonadales bacterium]|nr:type II secretion system protein GspL [Pseudomonadales bacterium]